MGHTNSFVEWWYFTTLLHDTEGNKDMLFDTIFKYDSKENPFVAAQPEVVAKIILAKVVGIEYCLALQFVKHTRVLMKLLKAHPIISINPTVNIGACVL
jgi:hypothetical protein